MIKFFYKKLIITFDSLTLLLFTNSKRKDFCFVSAPNNPLTSFTLLTALLNIFDLLLSNITDTDISVRDDADASFSFDTSYIAKRCIRGVISNLKGLLRNSKQNKGVMLMRPSPCEATFRGCFATASKIGDLRSTRGRRFVSKAYCPPEKEKICQYQMSGGLLLFKNTQSGDPWESKLPSNISYILHSDIETSSSMMLVGDVKKACQQRFASNTASLTYLKGWCSATGVNKKRDVSVYNNKQINNIYDITNKDSVHDISFRNVRSKVSDVGDVKMSKYKKVCELAVKSIVKNLQVSWPWLFTILYFVFMLIFPILSLLNTASKNLFFNFWETATEPVALSAYTVTISMAFFASIFNTFFGFILAWILVRYNFPGKRLLDAAVDLPFALPTSVAGLTLATVYNDQGWIGSFLSNFGIQIVFTKLGILIAMIFVSFPFVVRTLQPVLQEMEIELEEAAWSLGAEPWKTFQKIIFPPLIPAILTGFTLAFSRGIGEYGSIVIVSSNIPLKDLIASVLIFQNLEQYDYTKATVIGTVVLILSLILLLGIIKNI